MQDGGSTNEGLGTPVGGGRNSQVFLSHASEDAELAEAFEELLRGASGGHVSCFRSTDMRGISGIRFGDDWNRVIMERLDEATDVVALITPRSVNRPWILYEVGVGKGKINTPVLGIPVGLSISELDGPFRQWQNCECELDPLVKLVLEIITRRGDAKPSEKVIRSLVQDFIEKVRQLDVGVNTDQEEKTPPSEFDRVFRYLEEIKQLIRSERRGTVQSQYGFESELPPELVSDLRLALEKFLREPTRRYLDTFFVSFQVKIMQPGHSSQALRDAYKTLTVAVDSNDKSALRTGCSQLVLACRQLNGRGYPGMRPLIQELRQWLHAMPVGKETDEEK